MGESGGDEEEEEGREREREGQAVRILLRSSEGGREARQTDRQMAMAFARARKIRLAAASFS